MARRCRSVSNPAPAPVQPAQKAESFEPNAPAAATIEQAVSEFLVEYAESAPSTKKKYNIMMKKLQAFSKAKGYVMVHQWGPADVREFRKS